MDQNALLLSAERIVPLRSTAYALLRVQRVITFKGAAHVWEVMLEKEVVFIDILQYLPALLGVLLAVVQFVPEMARNG